ncbi:MAG TPA: TonB family protein [Candidatus Limnocylindrales bacterium]|nr:TonB family protein [Candidatus Limnocylindrales bacterium]
MPYQRQILLARGPVPRPSIVIGSIAAHLILVALVLVFRHTAGVRIVPPKYETVQAVSGGTYLAFNAAAGRHASPLRAHRRRRTPARGAGDGGAALQALRGHAQKATAGMLESFKFLGFYGFSPDHYELAIQTAGALPSISAAELPPHFEQLVTVEVTIDVDGRVADARVVGGMVDPGIARTLLAAIREFKYHPAKRDGTPIPSQLDLVIHIPS